MCMCYVCVPLCIFVLYVCMYVYNVYTYVCMFVCLYVCLFVCTERLKGMWSIMAKYNFAYHKNVFAVTLLVILKTNFWLYL